MSKKAIHQTFGISRSTLDHWLKRREDTGDVKAITHYRHGPAPAISDTKAFEQFAQFQNGSTLEQMAAAWQQQTGQKVSTMSFSRALKRLGWTRKKRVFSTANATLPNAKNFCAR